MTKMSNTPSIHKERELRTENKILTFARKKIQQLSLALSVADSRHSCHCSAKIVILEAKKKGRKNHTFSNENI